MRFVALTLAVCFSCTKQVPQKLGATPDIECTLETALVPGIPGSPGHFYASPRNPNGESELAHLMRDMVDDLTSAKAALKNGRRLKNLEPKHRQMRCAWPTDIRDRTSSFDALAVAYLAQVKALDEAPSPTVREINNVLAACAACHENTCPGPLAVIEALKCE
jgi:cytochrome c553